MNSIFQIQRDATKNKTKNGRTKSSVIDRMMNKCTHGYPRNYFYKRLKSFFVEKYIFMR